MGTSTKERTSPLQGFQLFALLFKEHLRNDLETPWKLLLQTFAGPLYLVCFAGLGFWFSSSAGTDPIRTFDAFPQKYVAPLRTGASSIWVGGDVGDELDTLFSHMVSYTELVQPAIPNEKDETPLGINFQRSNITAGNEFKAFCFNESSVEDNFSGGVFFTSDGLDWTYDLVLPGVTTPKSGDVFMGTEFHEVFLTYSSSSYLGLQQAANVAIQGAVLGLTKEQFVESLSSNNTQLFPSFLQAMPLKLDEFQQSDWWKLATMGAITGFGVQFAFFFTFPSMAAVNIHGIPRAYQLMGLSQFSYWMHWFVQLSIYAIPASFVAAAMIKYAAFMLPSADIFILALHYLFCYMACSLLFILIVHLPKKQEQANGFTFLIPITGVLLSLLVAGLDLGLGWMLFLTLLHPVSGIAIAFYATAKYDYLGTKTGITWSNLWESNVGPILICQILGILPWLFVCHLKYGQSKFAVHTRRWFSKFGSQSSAIAVDEQVSAALSENIEPVSNDQTVTVNIENLHKSFGPKKVLRGLSMKVCRGEVFGFLGANGAGKTVTCSLLSGELFADQGAIQYHFQEGAALVGTDSSASILRRVGFCLQHDVLMEGMTCRQQLRHSALIKGGVPCSPGQSLAEAVDAEVDRLIRAVKFENESDVDKPISTYSGGMKRRVSIAIALLGDPQVVFLDEPTAGVDPVGRRAIWDMIEAAKPGKSIVLTTHFMDEADALSDRIGIINEGVLAACGSSLFLKNRFGVGFTVSFQRHRDSAVEDSLRALVPEAVCVSSVSVTETERVSNTGVTETERVSNTGVREEAVRVTWRLPLGVEPKIPGVLRALQEHDCRSVVASLTSMEQVFMRVGADKSLVQFAHVGSEVGSGQGEDEKTKNESAIIKAIWQKPESMKIERLRGLRMLRVIAKLVFKNAFGNPEFLCISVLFPLVIIIAGFVAGVVLQSDTNPPPYDIAPDLLSESPEPSHIWTIFGLSPRSTVLPQVRTDPAVLSNTTDFFRNETGYLGGVLSNGTLMFNGTLTHALPVLYSALANRALGPLNASLRATVVPAPLSNAASNGVVLTLLPSLLLFGLLSVAQAPTVVLSLRELGVLQVLHGYGYRRKQVYQAVGALVYLVLAAPPAAIALLAGLATSNPLLGDGGRWLATALVLLALGFAVVPLFLAMTPLFATAEQAGAWTTGIFITLATVPISLVAALAGNESQEVRAWNDGLTLLPPYAGMRGLRIVLEQSNQYRDEAVTWARTFAWETRISYCLVLLVAEGAACWLAIWWSLRAQEKAELAVHRHRGKTDEEAPAHSGSRGVSIQNVSKSFYVPKKDAMYRLRLLNPVYLVRSFLSSCLGIGPNVFQAKYCTKTDVLKDVSLEIGPNQVYILLGPNGAGKTTLCSTLLRTTHTDHGGSFLGEMEDTSLDAFYHMASKGQLGYLPQANVNFGTLSVLENARAAAELRGMDLSDPETTAHLEALLQATGLNEHLSKKPDALSGGYKRKLNLLIACVGFPIVLIADEMSSGVDAAARAHIHEVFKRGRELGVEHGFELPATLLSTHIMDEARTLATCIGIMVQGELVADGSVEQLSRRFCKHNYMEVVFNGSSDALERSEESPEDGKPAAGKESRNSLGHEKNLEHLFAQLEELNLNPFVKEQQGRRVKIRTEIDSSRDNTLQLADLFEILESVKEQLNIQFYNVTAADIEDIFIDIADGKVDDLRKGSK